MPHAIWMSVLMMAGSAWAQDGARGHWSGSIDVPETALKVEVDLDKTAKGWVGSIAIPAQGNAAMALEAIAFQNGKWTFRIKGVPGAPTFSGTISEDGKTMSGDFTQGPGVIAFKLARNGEPKVEEPKSSPAVAKEFTGQWEGTLEAGTTLRLIVKIANGEAGSTAVMISVDQGGQEILVSAITQKDAKLSLDVKMINGGYEGEINKEGTELNGTWTQGPNSFPLKFKKAAGAQPQKN